MLLGEYEHTIDDKNRLTLPARFRAAFAEGVVVTRGLDDCLYAYPPAAWAGVVDRRLATLDTFSKESRRMQRFFYAGAVEAELDKQGRVTIPTALMSHAKLERDVVVAGVNDHLEIWDRAAWQRELADVEGSAEDVAERLAAQSD
ncbi:MAG: division/cell wall cluster transcriptional repressor MraZ [Actinobacteria bacterium]|nr:division/cell wall cluster transcriptional repressor MraZ [Actinomycetota bacterium]MBV8562101.1 division/cell wall cluster transcriptional repressor MraZ [Actinomycetota bacterium]